MKWEVFASGARRRLAALESLLVREGRLDAQLLRAVPRRREGHQCGRLGLHFFTSGLMDSASRFILCIVLPRQTKKTQLTLLNSGPELAKWLPTPPALPSTITVTRSHPRLSLGRSQATRTNSPPPWGPVPHRLSARLDTCLSLFTDCLNAYRRKSSSGGGMEAAYRRRAPGCVPCQRSQLREETRDWADDASWLASRPPTTAARRPLIRHRARSRPITPDHARLTRPPIVWDAPLGGHR